MLEGITSTQVYIAIIVNGVCTGIGVAIGTYLANRFIIKKMERISNTLKKLKKNKLNK